MPDLHRLEASGVVRLASSDAERPVVQLILAKSMGELKVEIVEPAVSRGIPLVEHKDRPGDASVVWTLSPKSAFPAGEAIVIRFSYAGGEKPAFVFYLGPDGSFAGGVNTAWYPQFIDSVDGALRATGSVLFHLPDGYTAVASGVSEPVQRQERVSFLGGAADLFLVCRS